MSPDDIKKLKDYGWDQSEKGKHGGQTDLYRNPKSGVIYQKPKGGRGYGEPIDDNWNDGTRKSFYIGVGIGVGIGIYEIGKWGLGILLAPETAGASLIGAGALP